MNLIFIHPNLFHFVRFCLFCVVFFLVLCVTVVFAQEPRKLTYEQASGVLAGLTELDGPRQEVAPDGRVLKRGTYDLELKTVVLIATDQARAKECATFLQIGQNALQKKWADPKTGRVPDEKMNDYVTELNGAGKDICSLTDFAPIRWDDLRPSANKFPPSVVSNLLPILIMPDNK